MASSSTSAPGGVAPDAVDIPNLKSQVYEACLEAVTEEPRLVIKQDVIFGLGIISGNDIGILLQVTQALVDEKLFKIVTEGSGMGWKIRSVEEARKYRTLKPEHEIVYSLIDEAGDAGIWSKTIKARTNLHDSVFIAAIKHLESKNMISSMKSVEHPTRKMYIKASVQPSERATGGPWYTDGELDDEFVAVILQVCYSYIKMRSFYYTGGRKKGGREKERDREKEPMRLKKVGKEEVRAIRDKALGPRTGHSEREDIGAGDVEDELGKYLPMPAGYQGYIGLDELTMFFLAKDFSKQTLTASDIQQALDILCYDDKIEKVMVDSGVAYRALRSSLLDIDDMGSVASEAPCGRCPVFDLCEEGGPVGPSNCEYFNDWLQL